MKTITLCAVFIVSLFGIAFTEDRMWAPLADKTLVVWTAPANLKQAGGSALTIDDRDSHFDAIVFGELSPQKWMAGSDAFKRTQKQQDDYEIETSDPKTCVQMGVVYRDKTVTIYRNGIKYASYEIDRQQIFPADSAVTFGKRHLDMQGEGFYQGKIFDARIYDWALTSGELAKLEPGESSDIAPWAWWFFSDGDLQEKTGHYGEIELIGDVRLRDGALVLGDNNATVIARPSGAAGIGSEELPTDLPVPESVVTSTRAFRNRLLADPYRPSYHFCVPEDRGEPGDPNGAFYYKGRYHLMYLYKNNVSGFCWGHVSSNDLLHWRYHPDAIGPGDGDEGCFSGGAFVDPSGKAILSYWQLWGARGIGLAESTDANFDRWIKSPLNPVVRSTEWGITEVTDDSGKKDVYGSADPSNIWMKDGRYYMLTGNLLVLNKYGRKPDSPADMQGDRLYLFRSDDLKEWEYVHSFYESNRQWTDSSEDNMCPSFLPLPTSPNGGEPSDKHLLLFISHNKGCQYYIGRYANDRFHPENHGRMTWEDNAYFAPEALVDGKGRQIMWAWIFDDRPEDIKNAGGWSGTYGLPRSLWLGDDGTLRMRPVEELKTLRLNERERENIAVRNGEFVNLDGFGGELVELEILIQPLDAKQCGVTVCCSDDGRELTRIYYDAVDRKLKIDTTRSSLTFGRKIVEGGPFEMRKNEMLQLRVFVDKSIVEAYANDRQAVARSIYPSLRGTGVKLFSEGGSAYFASVKAWDIMPSNPF